MSTAGDRDAVNGQNRGAEKGGVEGLPGAAEVLGPEWGKLEEDRLLRGPPQGMAAGKKTY